MTEENKPEPTAVPAGYYAFPITVDVKEGKAVTRLWWWYDDEDSGEDTYQFIESSGTYLIRVSYEGVKGSAETTFFLTLTGNVWISERID